MTLCSFPAWGEEAEEFDEQELEESYEWSISYIRALTVMTESLYREKNLDDMTRLHSILVNNKGVNYTQMDFFGSNLYQRSETSPLNKLLNRWREIVLEDFWYHQQRREKGDRTVGDVTLPWVEVGKLYFEKIFR
jgi:hypothetical protein